MKRILFTTILLLWALEVPADTTGAAVTTNEFPHSDVVKLFDQTSVEVAPDGSFTATVHVRSKILTGRGLKSAEALVPFNDKYQEVQFHFAKATQADGSELALKPADIETSPVFPGNPVYADIKLMRYRVRGAQVGSILDQEYVLKAKPLMADHFWMIWRARTPQPALDVRLVLRMPANRKFRWSAHHLEAAEQPEVTDSKDKQWKTYTWKSSGPTEIRAEPYMPSTEEFLPWIEISTVNSWEDVAKWLDQTSQSQIDSSPELQDRVRALTATLASATDKLASIYYWLEDNVRFVTVDLGLSGYKPHAASQTFQNRYGDAKDECVLLCAMLRDAGVPARLAFLESGSARKIGDRLPMLRHLTHCIVVVEAEGRTYYLDPTQETSRLDVVLGRLCNTELLLLGKNANKLVPSPTYDGTKHGTRESVKLQLAANGSVKGQVRAEYLGESDALIRAAMKYARPDAIRSLIEQEVKKNLPEGRLIDYEVGDVSQRASNFITSYRFEASGWARVDKGKLEFKPQLQQQIDATDELFSKPDRKHPISFFETAPSRMEMEVMLPDGYTVETFPKDIEFQNAFSYWKRTIRPEGQRLVITEMSNLKTAQLPKESVTEIHQYFEEAVTRKNETVVLKQK